MLKAQIRLAGGNQLNRMTFYKNILVCKRQLIQLQQSLHRMNPAMPAAAPAPSVKHLCYRCGFYFQARPQLEAHPCHFSQLRCPHCLYVLSSNKGASVRTRQESAQAQPSQHLCRRCPHCRNMYNVRDQHHQRHCEARFTVCQECQQRVDKASFRDHRNTCPFSRCYKCNAIVYKKMLAEHLIACCQIRKLDNRFNRKSVESTKPFHFYHFKTRNDSILQTRRVLPSNNICSPVPVCIENWLRH